MKQLLAQPERHRHRERTQTSRRKSDVGFEQTLKFQERFIVERYKVDVRKDHAFLDEAILHCFRREPGIVFLAREPLILARQRSFLHAA